ncbi:MAG: small multi-drug export protein [Acidimicrobiia bacterium]|nr:small multi-drug export protein [Acidimicrobiia bacterium]
MREAIRDWIQHLPLPEPVLVILIAMTPILELRGAIPFAQGIFNMSAVSAFWWSVLGNMIPVPIILWLFPGFVSWAEKHWPWIHRLMVKLQHRTDTKYSHRFDRLRDFALITFVAIPLPITGAWSGSLAAVVFGVDKKRAIPLILVGVLIAGVIVSLTYEALGLGVR